MPVSPKAAKQEVSSCSSLFEGKINAVEGNNIQFQFLNGRALSKNLGLDPGHDKPWKCKVFTLILTQNKQASELLHVKTLFTNYKIYTSATLK